MSIQTKERLVEDVAHGIGEFLTVTQTDAQTSVTKPLCAFCYQQVQESTKSPC